MLPIAVFKRLKYCLGLALIIPVTLVSGTMIPVPDRAQAQTSNASQAMTVRSDVQEANSETGVVTARGNVQINYPARQIQATAAQAQYFSQERRLVLTGNVYVLQQGNSIRAETMTYLIDEGRFIATPQSERQVESTYIVSDPESASETTAPAIPNFTP